MICLQFLVTAMVVAFAPGAGVIYTLALGLAAILHTSAVLFNAVKFAGVAYLLYLARGGLRRSGALAIISQSFDKAGWRIARKGALINIHNRKLSIFFLALLLPFLSGNPAAATTEMVLMGGIVMTMTFGVFALCGIFAAAARQWMLGSDSAMLWLSRNFAGIFAALAARREMERA